MAIFSSAAVQATSTVISGVTGATGPSILSFPVFGNNTIFEAVLNITGQATGIQVGIKGPSGCQVYAQVNGINTGSVTGAVADIIQMTTPTFINQNFNDNSSVGPMHIDGVVMGVTGVTGTAQIILGIPCGTGALALVGTGSLLITFPSS